MSLKSPMEFFRTLPKKTSPFETMIEKSIAEQTKQLKRQFAAKKMGGLTLSAFGQGSGLSGLPGDFTYGKSSFERQKTELKQKCHIVVGTPGRVLNHIEKGTFPLEKLKYLVIDEADKMLNMGFIDQVGAIIRHLPEERLTMLFSATFPEDVEQLSLQYMKDPLKIEMKAGGTTTFKVAVVVAAML